MALTFVKNKPPSEAAGQIDLDVTPIMSMFMILLPFLVSMAVLTHLTMLQFSLPPNVGGGSSGSNEEPRLKITVVVTPQYLAITHGESLLDSIPLKNNEFDFALLGDRLTAHRQSMPLDSEIVVASRDQVKLKNVVAIMDKCRETGFSKVGLSSATDNPESGK